MCWVGSIVYIAYIHDLNHLWNARKEGKATQHNGKTKQHITTQLSYFQRKKMPRVGFEPMTMRLLGVRSYQLSYRGSSAGSGSNHIYNTKQPKHLNQNITNQINRLTQTRYEGEGHGNQTSKDTKTPYQVYTGLKSSMKCSERRQGNTILQSLITENCYMTYIIM